MVKTARRLVARGCLGCFCGAGWDAPPPSQNGHPPRKRGPLPMLTHGSIPPSRCRAGFSLAGLTLSVRRRGSSSTWCSIRARSLSRSIPRSRSVGMCRSSVPGERAALGGWAVRRCVTPCFVASDPCTLTIRGSHMHAPLKRYLSGESIRQGVVPGRRSVASQAQFVVPRETFAVPRVEMGDPRSPPGWGAESVRWAEPWVSSRTAADSGVHASNEGAFAIRWYSPTLPVFRSPSELGSHDGGDGRACAASTG